MTLVTGRSKGGILMRHLQRRLVVAAAVAALLAAGASAPAAADRDGPGDVGWTGSARVSAGDYASAPSFRATVNRAERAAAALARVQRLFAPGGDVTTTGRDATMALRDLRLLYPALSAAGKAQADRFLARPDEGAGDPQGDGYTVPEATPVCGDHVCIHYVTSTEDSIPNIGLDANANGVPDYVDFALATMEDVHQTYVGAGYRPPKADGGLGTSALTDVYLANVGDDGLYGYCTSDQDYVSGVYDIWAYCVLDNDYSASEFPTNTPSENFQVTAAHEYFHAVQFGYDFAEDAWFMEATATWAEDELYDAVNDNVAYLPAGQLGEPLNPLDWFSGAIHYGNWIFFRYLTERFPAQAGGLPVLVRAMWNKADSAGSAPDLYSTQAIKSALAAKSLTFTKAFAQFTAVNRFSRKFYDEGRANAYPQAPIGSSVTLGKGQASTWLRGSMHHLTSYAAQVKPRRVTGTWKLKVTVDMTGRVHQPAVVVDRVKPNGAHVLTLVALNKTGAGSLKVPFANRKTARVVVTLVNAGIRYDCWQGQPLACSGIPLDDSQPVGMKVAVVR